MVLQIDEKKKVKFDVDEKQYIYYRILSKSEMEAHLASANKELDSITIKRDTFQAYIDDERVIELIAELE